MNKKTIAASNTAEAKQGIATCDSVELTLGKTQVAFYTVAQQGTVSNQPVRTEDVPASGSRTVPTTRDHGSLNLRYTPRKPSGEHSETS